MTTLIEVIAVHPVKGRRLGQTFADPEIARQYAEKLTALGYEIDLINQIDTAETLVDALKIAQNFWIDPRLMDGFKNPDPWDQWNQ